MNLVLHTLTRNDGTRDLWLKECELSAQQAISQLPGGVVSNYFIFICPEPKEFPSVRWAAMQKAPLISSIDDDYILLPSALKECFQALETSGAGIAFTQVEGYSYDSITYQQLCTSAKYVCTAYILRRECLDSEFFRIAQDFGCEFDWIIRTLVALKYGAVYIKTPGVIRRKHMQPRLSLEPWYAAKVKEQKSRIKQFLTEYNSHGTNPIPS